MLRTISFRLLILVLTLVIAAGSVEAKRKTFDELCVEILETLQTFYPVKSSYKGNHHYDMRLADYSSKSVRAMVGKLNGYEKDLHRFKKANLSAEQQLNLKLIKANVDIALQDLQRIKWHTRSPMLYVDEALGGVYSLVVSDYAPLQEKRVFILSRMKSVPGLFSTARRNLKNVSPIYIEAAVESLESTSEFYREVGAVLMHEFPDKANDILKTVTAAREAMNDFSVFLTDMQPGEETAFAIGKTDFDYKLSNQFFLDYDSDSLLRLGESLLADAQAAYLTQKEYVEYEHQNGRDSVFVPASFARQDILDYYQWETDQVRIFCEQSEFITIPEDIAPVTVVETPPALRSMVPGIAYEPPGILDTTQHGFFYVRPLPEEMERPQLEARYRYVHRRGFKGSVVHEAFPGHHLQFQLAAQTKDPVRMWQDNDQMIEGWALYGTEDPAHWLNILGGIRYRAARIVSDVKLHTGQFTPEECFDWMVEVLETDSESGRQYLKKEIRKQTLNPTNRMSYLTGKMEIMKLRDAAFMQKGTDFDLQTFHDEINSFGLIPPALLWEQMGLTKTN